MKTIVFAAAFMALLSTAAVGQPAPSSGQGASPQSDYNADDVVKSFQQKPPPTAVDQCNPDADGVCQPSKDSRGFSLEDAAPAPAIGAKPKVAEAPRTRLASVHHRLRQPAADVAPVSRRDLLINFRLGSSELTDRSKANARVFVSAMSRPELAGATFEIGGHTDATGSPVRNRVLAQQRAESVRQYMIEQGADASRLKAVGYGSDQPVDARHPDAAVNRRVEARRLT